MQDAVRASESLFTATYERAYHTWSRLWHRATPHHHHDLREQLAPLQHAFPNHPYFPEDLLLLVDKSFSNTVTVSGKTIWRTSRAPCHLPSFRDRVTLQAASTKPTIVDFTADPDPRQESSASSHAFLKDYPHIPVLLLGWAYVLSARWGELIPGARIVINPLRQEEDQPGRGSLDHPDSPAETVVVDVGEVSHEARAWWETILAEDAWDSSIHSDTGRILQSPWSVKTQRRPKFVLATKSKDCCPRIAGVHSTSFKDSFRYLSEYCQRHDIASEYLLALSGALFFPAAKYDNRRISLPMPPRLPRSSPPQSSPRIIHRGSPASAAWEVTPRQLDRLLTLSCNVRGIKSLLCSVFFEPDIPCNVCGAWLQGSFAFLDSSSAQDPRRLLQTLIGRDPGLGFLWHGAFVTGVYTRCLQEGRMGWWKVDIGTAASTGTHASFIQEESRKPLLKVDGILRADECRLMYLGQEPDNRVPPLFPFAPFGSTALEDVDLEVCEHSQCQVDHFLQYEGFAWECQNGQEVTQSVVCPQELAIRRKGGGGQEPGADSPCETVDFNNLEYEDDDVSEMVTRNIFTWLRGEAGFPRSERAIREHEWIENLDSDDDDDVPCHGDVRSAVGGENLGKWFLGLSTRAQSL